MQHLPASLQPFERPSANILCHTLEGMQGKRRDLAGYFLYIIWHEFQIRRHPGYD